MHDWVTELPAAIRAAIEAGGGEIIVATETQCELGRTALARMAPGMEGVTFRAAAHGPADAERRAADELTALTEELDLYGNGA